jgi:tetratricopeptide (TPR) repeat protein
MATKNKIMNRIDKLKEFLKATPTDSFLQHALALEYIKEGNETAAKVLFETILLREPNYVGSYYHLGKLLERNNNFAQAINIYKKGMLEAKAIKDNHSYNELMGALEDLEDN